ncbi:MAG: PEP-utilizing enzyme [Nitrospiraceae bacterium]|nr:PEP-utilizing enzyme [Nitrospiraceae bacterium]
MICSLDYLVGTLATAYKGVITSLVVKDFCICDENGSALLKGTVLSMPAGDYHASLIRDGVELARSPIKDNGDFEMRAGSGPVVEARDLQIDILQNGNHTGTFLLKRERSGIFYTPAIELSDEVKGVDFKLLTLPLREKPGLLSKAENIVYKILSAKKDWRKFSDELHGFATDLFWGERDVFYRNFEMLAKFSFLGGEKSGKGAEAEKPVEDCLDLIGLPLSKETDQEKLGGPVQIWLKAMDKTKPDFSYRIGQAVRVISKINENKKLPEGEIRPALSAFVSAVRRRVGDTPVFSEAALAGIRGFMPEDKFEIIGKWGQKGRESLLALVEEAGLLIGQGDYAGSLMRMNGARQDLEYFLDGRQMIRSYFDLAREFLSGENAPAFKQVLFELLDFPAAEAPDRDNDLVTGTAGFIEKFIATGRTDLCASLLTRVGGPGKGGGLKTGLILNRDIAALVLGSGNDGLIAVYRELLKKIVVPSPGIRGYSPESWAESANPLHLEILSGFLDVLSVSPQGLDDVKAHLICNLFLSGVFIPDDRLFQRRISAYLNSPAMSGDFLLNFMLLRKFPVYFSEIGAASRIRDYTTQLDSWGNDPVLYFLRKQVHVNASNYNVRLAEGIIKAWVDNDPGLLETLVPADVFRNFNKATLDDYHRAIRPFFEALGLFDEAGGKVVFERLLAIHGERMAKEIERVESPEETRSKVFLLCRIYQEIVKKYSLPYAGNVLMGAGCPDEAALYSGIGECLEHLEALKKTVLSPIKTEPKENLYFKRHIAFGIPSVLGTYREEKFDALGDFLRTGEKARLFMEGIISDVSGKNKQEGHEPGALTSAGMKPGTKQVKIRIDALRQVYGILNLHGIFENFQVRELSRIFETNRLFTSQVLDMLRIWQKELKWAVESFSREFLPPLGHVLKTFFTASDFQYGPNMLPDYLLNLDPKAADFVDKASDIIIRDMMAGLPGFTEADGLIDAMTDRLSDLIGQEGDTVFNPEIPEEQAEFFVIEELTGDEAMRLSPVLGGKAKNLVYLKKRDFPVPPGAVFSSRHTEDYMAYTASGGFMDALRDAVRKIEERTGEKLGGAENPLFLSVRSGSYISMPGILISILYCGMNQETLNAFIKKSGQAWLAWDSYRRFLEHYGKSVLGVGPEVFDDIKQEVIKKSGLASLEFASDVQLSGICRAYLDAFSASGLSVPDDVYEQLRNSVRAVYGSWHGERPAQFARFTGMSRHWGTAVSIMQMVKGNQPGAGAAVFFTRDPATMEKSIYGEIREKATGDELVYGARTNRPITKKQKEMFGGEGSKSLEESDPEFFRMMNGLAQRIEEAMGGLPQEVETTYLETGGEKKVYVLQTRRMEFFDSGFIPRFEEICMMEPRVIGRGIGVHGGALSGVASFSLSNEEIRALGRKTGLPVIILRNTASTNDVSLMTDIQGIITAAGGATSHASVLAQKFDLTAIVGCKELNLDIDREGRPFARIGKAIITEGAPISIDGATGLIFSGTCLHTSKGRYR